MSNQPQPQTLGKYTVVRELGHGGFTTVYLARDTVQHHVVVLKILRPALLADLDFQNATPYNPVFAQAYLDVKDFWNIPEYNKMLPIQMEQLNLAITGQADPKQALDTIATEQQQIIDGAYPNGPPK